jgi:hypothetical protein
MTRVVVPALTAILSVVALIGVYGWNRSREPRLRITLTERELPVMWSNPNDERGTQVRVEFERRVDPLDARNWLTESRLRAMGFAFDVMPGAPEADDTYNRALPRIAWVAFDYDGAAWRDIARIRALMPRISEPPRSEASSRLVPVDADRDLDVLVARYPSGHLILRAAIDLRYIGPAEKGPLVYGYIRHLIPDRMTVPRALADRLRDLPTRDAAPRYEVDVVLGRLGIPYVTDVRLMN